MHHCQLEVVAEERKNLHVQPVILALKIISSLAIIEELVSWKEGYGCGESLIYSPASTPLSDLSVGNAGSVFGNNYLYRTINEITN